MSKIYLDMDGVLADFDKLMRDTFGKTFKDISSSSQDRWSIVSKELPDLYNRLDKLMGSDELVTGVYELAANHGYTVGVLTALPSMGHIPNALTHKKLWLKRHYPQLLEDFNIGPHAVHKQNFAEPGYVLIDDMQINIAQWTLKGGTGILYTNANEALTMLREYLENRR